MAIYRRDKMEQYLKLVDQKIKDLEAIIKCQIEDNYQEYIHYSDSFPMKNELLKNIDEEIIRIEAEIKQWKNIKTMLLAWQVAYDNTFGDDYRYEINIYKSDKNYALFDEAFKLTNKIMSGEKR